MQAKQRQILAVMIVAATITSGLPASARSMTCPSPHPDSGPGVMKASSVQLAETGSYLASSADPNRVPEVIVDLRKRYPSVSNAEVENYLVAAYCPEVAKLNGLTEGEQTARVQLFSRQVETALHTD